MPEDPSSQSNAAAGPSNLRSFRTTTPPPNPAVAATRQQSNTSTPRTIRTDGKFDDITKLRDQIALEMDGEFVECPIEEFIRHYIPFEPKDSDVENYVKKATYTPQATVPAVPATADTSRPVRATTAAAPPSRPNRRSDQILEWVGKDLRFIQYKSIPETPRESTTYADLETIINAIGGAIVTGRSRNKFRYSPCPDKLLKSETPGTNNKIDGCIISNDCFANQEGKVDFKTTCIAVAFEFKLKAAGTTENNVQLVSANVQLMNDDVRRMFTYGVTIVDEMVTLWYQGRSHSAVSEPFSFVQEPTLFIKVMMSFLFATEAELGYDPTITRLPDNQLLFEIVDAQGITTYYRTIRTLSDFRSLNITGRMTRVWEVEQVANADGSGEVIRHGVLKDVWLDESAPTEREIQQAIFEDIETKKIALDSNLVLKKLGDKIARQLEDDLQDMRYKKYFLTILADCQGHLCKAQSPVAWRRHGLLLPEITPVLAENVVSEGVSLDRVSSAVPRETKAELEEKSRREKKERVFHSKRQYRSFCQELCTTVSRMPTFGEAMSVLNDILAALRLLFFAGWVHRDISSGNVMAHGVSSEGQIAWQAKLCDLEYAKRYSSSNNVPSGDPKTGTPYFMAHEILKNKPLLPVARPATTKNDDGAEAKNSNENKVDSHREGDVNRALEQREAKYAKRQRDKSKVAIREKENLNSIVYHFQHDVESIWWLTLYTAAARIDYRPSQKFASRVFQNCTDLEDRPDCLLRPIESELERRLHPKVNEMIVPGILEELRLRLVMQYHEIDAARLANGSVAEAEIFADIHQEFYVAFRVLIEETEQHNPVPLAHEKANREIIGALQPRYI